MNKFPIITDTSCLLKWTWSTVMLNRAKTSSCHRVDQINLTNENFLNFHNLPKKLEDRQAMLDGKRPVGGCEYCFKIEDAGGFSDRQLHMNHEGLTPPELDTNPNAIEVTPRILEVYFNNTCNLSCLYCSSSFSSVWENEYKKYGDIPIKNFQTVGWKNPENYDQLVDKFWEWMRKHSNHLRKFQILGGEPFFQPEFINCLNHFEEYPNPHCEFVIITNLMVDDKRMDYYIERFKKLVSKRKLKGLQVTASLDCWGPQAEYIRSGLDLAQWQRNFEKLLQLKWVRLQINHAVCGLSIKYMPDLLVKVSEWNKTRKIYLSFMSVVAPHFMNPDIFGKGFFDEDFDKILQLMPNDSPFDASTLEYLSGLHKQISVAETKPERIADLKIFLTEIDRRRGTYYRKLFPWLAEIFENNA